MVSYQFHGVAEDQTYLPMEDHETDRKDPPCNRGRDEHDHRLGRSGPGSHRGHQLDVAAPHAPHQKEQIKDPSSGERTDQATLEPRPSRDKKPRREGREKASIGQPVGNPSAPDVLYGSPRGNTQSTDQ